MPLLNCFPSSTLAKSTGTITMSYRGPQKNPLVVLSDGSWCGRERGAESNVFKLANMIWGGVRLPKNDDFAHLHPSGKARYVNSAPVASTFME